MSETIIKIEGGVIRQQKNTILKEVNIEIKNGEFIYLIGKVGSGKSSFLKTLYAELPLEYGTGEVAGFQLKKIKKSQIPLLRRKCGIVFQDFKLLTDRNVYDNLEFVLKATGWDHKKAIRERIETVLTKVGMLEKQEKMPHQLSGGEQQRIVLARALLNAPPIILADEPTGNIDPETSYHLIELLREICDTGKTIIIATHQYDLIERYPGRVLRCEDGKLFDNTPISAGEKKEEEEMTPEEEEKKEVNVVMVTETIIEQETGNEGETMETATIEELTFTEVVSFDEIEEEQAETLQELTFAETETAIVTTGEPEEEAPETAAIPADETENKEPEDTNIPAVTIEEQTPPVAPPDQQDLPAETLREQQAPKAEKQSKRPVTEKKEEEKTENKPKPPSKTKKNDRKDGEDQNPPPVFGFELIE